MVGGTRTVFSEKPLLGLGVEGLADGTRWVGKEVQAGTLLASVCPYEHRERGCLWADQGPETSFVISTCPGLSYQGSEREGESFLLLPLSWDS